MTTDPSIELLTSLHSEVGGVSWRAGACGHDGDKWPCHTAVALGALSTANEQRDAAVGALEKLNAIRDQAVRTQRASWSSLVYPLVAILNEASIRSTVTDEELDTLFPSRALAAADGQGAADVLCWGCSCG